QLYSFYSIRMTFRVPAILQEIQKVFSHPHPAHSSHPISMNSTPMELVSPIDVAEVMRFILREYGHHRLHIRWAVGRNVLFWALHPLPVFDMFPEGTFISPPI